MAPTHPMKPISSSPPKAASAKAAAHAQSGKFQPKERADASSPKPPRARKKSRKARTRPKKSANPVTAKKSQKALVAPPPVSTSPSAMDAPQGIERPRVSMGEALRSRGMDETALAERFVGAVNTLGDKNETGDGVEKLYVDLLKECSRHLGDDAAPSAGAPARESRVIINLIHNVRRPD